MFTKLLTQLTAISVAFCAITPIPDIPIPANGKYRIQNAETGLFWDERNFGTAPGTQVIVQTLNQPVTSNQEWTLASNGQIGTLKGDGTTFASASIDSTKGLVITLDNVATNFQLIPVAGGALICVPPNFGCLTSPATAVTQISVTPRTGASDQVWIFEAV